MLINYTEASVSGWEDNGGPGWYVSVGLACCSSVSPRYLFKCALIHAFCLALAFHSLCKNESVAGTISLAPSFP